MDLMVGIFPEFWKTVRRRI